MPEPVINVATPAPAASAGRPSTANESEASGASAPFSDVFARKLDQTGSHSGKPLDKSAVSDSGEKDVATGDDIAAVAAPAGQILPPDVSTLQFALNIPLPATAVAPTPLVAQNDGVGDGDRTGAEVVAAFSPLTALNAAGATQPVSAGNGEPSASQDGQAQVPGLVTQLGAHTGQGKDLNADQTQLSAADTFSIENTQPLANETPALAKTAEAATQALTGLAVQSQPNSAPATTALGMLNPVSGTAPHNAQSASASVSTPISLPVTHPDWDQALGQRVVWLVKQDVQGAELRINPPQLGPVEMRIVMNNDQASVSFTSQHAIVREALEAAVPRLRDMFSDSGLNLVNVNVSQHSFAQQRQDNPYAANSSNPLNNYATESEPAGGALSGTVTRVINGLVDLYA